MDFTGIARKIFAAKARELRGWNGREAALQEAVLRRLLTRACSTEFGRRSGFAEILSEASSRPGSLPELYRQRVPLRAYEDFRGDIMRMIHGAPDVLWPGVCRNFAQSSGTTGGRSKYLPVTLESLRENHYRGASFSVAMYLESNPRARMFSGKGLILGGSFATEATDLPAGVVVGDLSATLIDRVNPLVNMFRVPDKQTALLADWQQKLPRLAGKALGSNITNISGVPSWMLQVLLKVLELRGATALREVWPGLEVFFHGGISFVPYREEYRRLCAGLDMHFAEVYNASEGYFAVQADGIRDLADPGTPSDPFGMTLLVDAGVFFEFLPLGEAETVDIEGLRENEIYELVVSTPGGLWRYRLGDTVRVESLKPLRISVAGRTKSFINAFGEELMEENAERAVAEACRITGSSIHNYTAAPVYAHGHLKGRHQWIVEWKSPPASIREFASLLDAGLRNLNSDYDAKRSHDIFLDMPEVVSVPHGTFQRWLTTVGSGKLGGQRKVPRLSNDRTIADRILNSL